MLGLLVCFVLSEVLQPETLRAAFRTTFTKMERIYGDRARNLYGVILLNLFRIGTFAMALYAFTYHSAPFSLRTYGIIIGVVLAVLTVRAAVSWLVAYTFELQRTVVIYLPQYDNLWTMLCVLLYPAILLCINFSGEAFHWLAIAIGALFVGVMIFKIVQYFYAGPQSVLYLLIYVVTLELLPLGAIIVTTQSLT